MMREQSHINETDRRLGFERRQFSYSSYFPERRMVDDRRDGDDRRQKDVGWTYGDRRLNDRRQYHL